MLRESESALARLKELIVSISRVSNAKPCIFNSIRPGIRGPALPGFRTQRPVQLFAKESRGFRAEAPYGGRLLRHTSRLNKRQRERSSRHVPAFGSVIIRRGVILGVYDVRDTCEGKNGG